MSLTEEKRVLRVTPGDPTKSGVEKKGKGYNFQITVSEAKKAELLLYEKGAGKLLWEIPLPKEGRIGESVAACVEGIKGSEVAYQYRIDGKNVLDPYAGALEGRTVFGDTMENWEETVRCLIPDKAAVRTKALQIPYEDLILYKTHVRGFTMDDSSKAKYRGTFRGVKEKIAYLKDLGINGLELMPVYEYFEMPDEKEAVRVYQKGQTAKPRINYWGYGNRALYFAPKKAFSATGNPCGEFAELVDALHRAGICCILEFCFGAELSIRFMLDVLHYWQLNYGVDGFHVIGNDALIREAARDPLLKKTKLIFTGFDGDWVYNGHVPDSRNVGEQNAGYQICMRRFLKGDEGCMSDFFWYLRKNPRSFGTVNYFGDHDGFTMMDMVSYDQKWNLENGEDNLDGPADNFSWNCGAEGETKKRSVKALRRQQLRNAFLLLFASQGTPLIFGGDEFGNSQKGNNNAWCQDNPIGWVDWSAAKSNRDLKEFVKKAIAFRKAHPMLHAPAELRLTDYRAYGYPDLSYHSERAWYPKSENTCRYAGVMYCGDYGVHANGSKDDHLYLACNMHWEPHDLALPNLQGNGVWKIAADTTTRQGFYEAGQEPEAPGKYITVPPRSILLLIGKQEEENADLEAF